VVMVAATQNLGLLQPTAPAISRSPALLCRDKHP
jgi:hypothetical protein